MANTVTIVTLTSGWAYDDGRNATSSKALPTTFAPHNDLCTLRGWAGAVIVASSYPELVGSIWQQVLDNKVRPRLLNDWLPFFKTFLQHLNLIGLDKRFAIIVRGNPLEFNRAAHYFRGGGFLRLSRRSCNHSNNNTPSYKIGNNTLKFHQA